MRIRWCTKLKQQTVERTIGNKQAVQYIGIAADESHRCGKNKGKNRILYPLVDWNITEQDAMQYCKELGFTFGGLYDKRVRVSCWCCPLQRISQLRLLYNEKPKLWKQLEQMEESNMMRGVNRCLRFGEKWKQAMLVTRVVK